VRIEYALNSKGSSSVRFVEGVDRGLLVATLHAALQLW